MRTKDLEITSKENPAFKELKEISKDNDTFIFIEGKKLFVEALKSQIKIERVYIDKTNYLSISHSLSDLKDCEIVYMKNDLLSSVFTTESKPSNNELVVALAKKPEWSIKDLICERKNLILLERVQDPGNLGAIIRSARAFNAGGIILTNDSVNPFNTKVVRSSAGAVFSLPIANMGNKSNLITDLRKEGYRIIALSLQGKNKIDNLITGKPCLFLFGNEGSGLSQELLSVADEVAFIPQSEKVESLNLGISVSLVLWEMYKK